MNIREYDEKIKAKEEIFSKMQEDLEKRKAKMEKVRMEIKQLKAEQDKAFGQDVLNIFTSMGITSSEQREKAMAKIETLLLEAASEEREVEKTADVTVDETEPVNEISETTAVDEVEQISETAETYTTTENTNYSKPFYQQNKGFFKNNNS